MLCFLLLLVSMPTEQNSTVEKWLELHPKAIDKYRTECAELTKEYINKNSTRLENEIANAKSKYETYEKIPHRMGAARPNAVKDGEITSFGSKQLKEVFLRRQFDIITRAEEELKELKAIDGFILKPLKAIVPDAMGRVEKIRVKQVVSDEEVIGRVDDFDEDVWFIISTKDLLDGRTYIIPDDVVIAVIGTKRYDTANGAVRTIRHVGIVKLPVKDEDKDKQPKK